jgi:hypothetical protein
VNGPELGGQGGGHEPGGDIEPATGAGARVVVPGEVDHLAVETLEPDSLG